MDLIMIHNIVIREEDLGHCIQAYTTMYIVLNLSVNVEGQVCIV